MSTPFTKYIDDLITRLRGGVPTRASAASPDAAEYLRKLEEAAAAARVSEDMARGSKMALRARNAEVDPLVELSRTELPIPEQITPRDVARVRSDEARRDARFGPFSPDDLNNNAWQWRRAAEQNLAEARAAQVAQDEARSQFAKNAAVTAALTSAAGTGVANSVLTARERAAKEQAAINATLTELSAIEGERREAEARRNYHFDQYEYGRNRVLRSDLPMSDYEVPVVVQDMPMQFDLPEAQNMSQSETAALQSEYKTPPGVAMPRRRIR
jgi:hypothetical protein